MTARFWVAAVQMTSGPDKVQNLEVAGLRVAEAAARGASLVGFPENFSWMGAEADKPDAAESLDGPTLTRMAGLARDHRIHVLAGSILEKGAPPSADGQARYFNTSVLLGPDGARLAVYRKLHLFDVEVNDGATYRESQSIAAGSEVVTVPTTLGRIGLSICYDLRFPELYRKHSAAGAKLLTVPSAFTLMTGKDHWEVLLRARAIENLAYVFAPAQGGRHSEKRVTYGHAMIVDPWGLVLARAPDGGGLALAEVDPESQARIRRDLPVLNHRRTGVTD